MKVLKRPIVILLSVIAMTYVWWYFRGSRTIEGFSSGAMSQLASNQTDSVLYGGSYMGAHNYGLQDNVANFSGAVGNPEVLSHTTSAEYNNRFAIPPRPQIYNNYRPPLTPQMQQAIMMRQMRDNAKVRNNQSDWWVMTHIIDPIFGLIFKILNNTIGRLI